VALCRIWTGDKLNRIGRDWVRIYKTAVMEFSRNKSPASIDVAERAIQKLLHELPIADSKVHRELKDALNSLAVLKRML
jgi:hypothetical protein